MIDFEGEKAKKHYSGHSYQLGRTYKHRSNRKKPWKIVTTSSWSLQKPRNETQKSLTFIEEHFPSFEMYGIVHLVRSSEG